MTYQALYRVWRPRTFKDVVGQKHITQTLQNAISQEKFSHAYLFSGPRGTGKTSAAKIFAQTINCEKAPTSEPCNTCSACLGILEGSISDVIEIDAASNTSVDDIRDIRDKVKYAPSSVPYKVYIIDEVHMISINAFNALLKTLEEPPAHVVFILATTEPHKIPLTIISRCQRFDFKPISNRVLVDRMREIAEKEQVEVDEKALEAVALAAEGGMRDALSTLDQAISFADDRVELEDVLAVTGGVSQSILTELINAMFDEKIEETLRLFDQIIENGKDPGRFVFDMIYFLRDLLFYKTTTDLEDVLERAIVDDYFEETANKVDVEWIQQAMMRFNQTQQDIKWTNSPKVFIEVALLEITHQVTSSLELKSDEPSHDELKELELKLKTLESKVEKMLTQAPKQAEVQPVRKKPARNQVHYKIPTEQIYGVLKMAKHQPLNQVKAQWSEFLSVLKRVNAPAHATIVQSKALAASNSGVVVGFKYEIHCSLFLDHRDVVESILTEVTGETLTIIPIPKEDWPRVRQDYIENYSSHNNEELELEETDEETDETVSDELVEAARELVGDDLLEIKE